MRIEQKQNTIVHPKFSLYSSKNFLTILFLSLYFIISIFEVYINMYFGTVIRYFYMLILFFLILRTKRFKFSRIDWLLSIWLLFYFASLLWSQTLQQAILYIYTVSLMVILTILFDHLRLNSYQLSILIFTYQLASGILGFLGLFFSQQIIPGRYMLVIGGNSVDPNNLVALYSVGVSISLYNIVFSTKRKIIDVIILLINLYVIFLSGSRSGIVIIVSVFIISTYFFQKKINSFLKKGLVIIISGIALFGIYYYSQEILPEDVFLRLFGNENLSFFNSTGRNIIWENAIYNWYESGFLFGLGWGGYEAHNTFLTILVDVGIVGSSFLFVALIIICYRCLKGKEILAIMLFFTGMVPSILIGAQNKRFFWNALIVPLIILNSRKVSK